jgi:hypothetical protein
VSLEDIMVVWADLKVSIDWNGDTEVEKWQLWGDERTHSSNRETKSKDVGEDGED